MDLKTSLLCLLALGTMAHVHAAPAQGHVVQPGSIEELETIILHFENILYKLKDYSRAVQANRKESASGAVVDANEQQLTASKTQQTSSDPKSKVPPVQATVDGGNDISLKDALDYLVRLAKEKKLERRDHDIPFPLTDVGRNADRESQ